MAAAKFVTPNQDRMTLSGSTAPVSGSTLAAPKNLMRAATIGSVTWADATPATVATRVRQSSARLIMLQPFAVTGWFPAGRLQDMAKILVAEDDEAQAGIIRDVLEAE